MFNRTVLAALVVAGLGACTTETRTVVVEEDSCSTYGFRGGTPEYRLCRERMATARHYGRAGAGYDQGRAIADSQAACESYGLTRYSDRYDQCVRDEYAARGRT
jgi:hypothetical protein